LPILSRDDRQTPALGEAGALETQSESTEIRSVTRGERIPTPRPHGGNELGLSHTFTVVDYGNERIFGIGFSDDSDLVGVGGNRIVDDVGYSSFEGIADIPQSLDQRRGVRRCISPTPSPKMLHCH